MTNYIQIEEALPTLINEFDWPHSFIRELYFTSCHSLQQHEDNLGQDMICEGFAPLNLRLMIAASGNPKVFGIEFICEDVKLFSFQTLDELQFKCNIDRDGVFCDFVDHAISFDKGCCVASRDVRVAFLGEEYLGPMSRLGYEIPSEDAIKAMKLEGYWRQCPTCFNAWEERLDIQYSRCPECGRLTALQ